MKTEFEQVYFETAAAWRNWLAEHHDKRKGIWLIYYKKHTGKPRVAYDEAVEEALCYGWIDSTVKRLDDERYMQQFTPRKEKSNWSELNKRRVKKLTHEVRMMPPGVKSSEVAKQNRKWFEPEQPQINYALSPEMTDLLKAKRKAFSAYNKLSPSKRKLFTNWVMSAKRPVTRHKRFNEMIELLLRGEDLGMK